MRVNKSCTVNWRNALTTKPIIVVGDRFTAFQRHKSIMGVSEFLESVASLDSPTKVVLGQGLKEADVERLAVLAAKNNPDLAIEPPLTRVEQTATHKQIARNVAISTPVRTALDCFSAHLLFDEGSELLIDHLTGQHIQGLALVEAARQLWTAVVELFLRQGSDPIRLVLDSVSAQFESYVFPLPAEMQLRVLEADTKEVGLKLSCSVEFRQNDRSCAVVEARIRSVAAKIAEWQETMSAREAVKYACTIAASH